MPQIQSVKVVQAPDNDPDLSWLETKLDGDGNIVESVRYSQEDMEQYGKEQVLGWIQEDCQGLKELGETWHMIGIYAEAAVVVCGTIQTIRTPWLWGIESDSEKEHKAGVALEELDSLRGILDALGVELSGYADLATKALMVHVKG